jgi:hypothetical protein
MYHRDLQIFVALRKIYGTDVDLQIFVALSCLELEASIARESGNFPLNALNPISLAWDKVSTTFLANILILF